MVISNVSPASGSIHGGQTITISGGGFSEHIKMTKVMIGATNCTVLTTTPSEVTCVTAPCSESCGDLIVSTGLSTQATSSDFSYLAASSPVVSAVSASGSTLTITGTSLGSSSSSVMLADSACTVTAGSDTSITCTLPSLAGGSYPVVVNNPDLGNSNDDVTHEVELLLNSLSPSTGSFGGGTSITLSGAGFSTAESRAVTVCGVRAKVESSTTTSLTVLTPANSGTDATLACDVAVVQASGNVSLASSFTYDASLTPTITSTSPQRGGTGGGTLVTISGTGFASTGNAVSIDGSICDIASESNTEITCYTNYHAGAIESSVIVEVPGQGFARPDDEAASAFYYIDRFHEFVVLFLNGLKGGRQSGHGEAQELLWQMKW